MGYALTASQYIAAEPSLPRRLLCRALIISYRSSPERSYLDGALSESIYLVLTSRSYLDSVVFFSIAYIF